MQFRACWQTGTVSYFIIKLTLPHDTRESSNLISNDGAHHVTLLEEHPYDVRPNEPRRASDGHCSRSYGYHRVLCWIGGLYAF